LLEPARLAGAGRAAARAPPAGRVSVGFRLSGGGPSLVGSDGAGYDAAVNAPANERWTVTRVRSHKGRGKLACVTVYDAGMARLLEEADIPLALVGDSVGMTVLGYDSTLPVTLAQMISHTAAARRGIRRALLIADMPFLTFQISPEETLRAAGLLLKDGGADAVKLEGGALRAATIRALVENGIPVMAHLGLLPQRVRAMGGYKVQGRDAAAADELLRDAQAVSAAGAFAVVLEGIPAALAARLTAAIPVPTIGIGAGAGCDGQVLVWHDLLGFSPAPSPRFVKRYAELGDAARNALRAFKADVETGAFPAPEHEYS